jgi:GT2 family glycosyltransferase
MVVISPCDELQYVKTFDTMRAWPDYYQPLFRPWFEGGVSPTQKMNCAIESNPDGEIMAFIHSDVSIYERGWTKRVLAEFDDPTVGVVGFGGALGMGDPDIYKRPYELVQLARFDYRSNTVDAEFHGERERGACDVATLDGFALIVRRELLDKTGCFPVELPFHNYDNWLCLMAHRFGYRVRMVGVECQHHGGGHSIKGDWQKQCVDEFGISDVEIHRRSHVYLYQNFREELPLRV